MKGEHDKMTTQNNITTGALAAKLTTEKKPAAKKVVAKKVAKLALPVKGQTFISFVNNNKIPSIVDSIEPAVDSKGNEFDAVWIKQATWNKKLEKYNAPEKGNLYAIPVAVFTGGLFDLAPTEYMTGKGKWIQPNNGEYTLKVAEKIVIHTNGKKVFEYHF